MMQQSDMAGLTPAQIKAKFALPFTPTHYVTVVPPRNSVIRTGMAGENTYGPGGGLQYQCLGQGKLLHTGLHLHFSFDWRRTEMKKNDPSKPSYQIENLDAGKLVIFQTKLFAEIGSNLPLNPANVSLYTDNDREIWTVNGMEECPYWEGENDCFIEAFNNNGEVRLISFNSFAFDLNLLTGKVKYRYWAK